MIPGPRALLALLVAISSAGLLAAASAAPTRAELARDHDLANGQRVVAEVCSICHQEEGLGAPLVGDGEAWAPRLAGGLAPLVERAIAGYEGEEAEMPARGGDDDLTDAEVADAVAWMADRALAAAASAAP